MKKKFKAGDEVYLVSHKPYFVKMKDAMLDPFKTTFIVEDVNYESNPADPLVTISRDGKSHIVRSKQLMVKAKIEIKKVRGEDNMKHELEIGDLVKIVTCHEGDNVVLGDLIGKVGIIDGFYGNSEIAEIYFGQLPEHAIISGWELHDCEGKYKESRYFRLGKEYLELIERKQDTECSNGKEDKYQVIKLSPTENQERQYSVMLIKNLTEIIEGKTIAFINSKGSGGVIYGRKANGLLKKLVISNPNKYITVVKTVKAHGKKEEAIKQISIKIEDRIEPSEFVL